MGDGLYLRPYVGPDNPQMGDGLYLKNDGVFSQTGGLVIPNIFAALLDLFRNNKAALKSLEGNAVTGLQGHNINSFKYGS